MQQCQSLQNFCHCVSRYAVRDGQHHGNNQQELVRALSRPSSQSDMLSGAKEALRIKLALEVLKRIEAHQATGCRWTTGVDLDDKSPINFDCEICSFFDDPAKESLSNFFEAAFGVK